MRLTPAIDSTKSLCGVDWPAYCSGRVVAKTEYLSSSGRPTSRRDQRRSILASRTLTTLAVAAFLGLVVTGAALSQTLDIKGLRIGISKDDVEQKTPMLADFTIAGVRSKYEHSPVSLEYREDKLDQMFFFFDPSGFDEVLGAVREKYPRMTCENSEVGNAMGAKFKQVQCSVQDSNSVLQVTRFVGDIRTSALTLMSKRALREQSETAKQRKKDI